MHVTANGFQVVVAIIVHQQRFVTPVAKMSEEPALAVE
jgi:hypothetical protein